MKMKFNDFRRGVNRKLSDNLIALSEAKISYNFDFSGGSLKAGLSFQAEFGQELTNSASIDSFIASEKGLQGGSIFYFKKYDFESGKDASKLIYVTPEFKFFYLPLDGSSDSFIPLGLEFSSRPQGICYRLNSVDVIIFSSPTDNMVVWDGVGEPEIVVDAPKITSMCLHSERLFATTSGSADEVWFSDDLDPTNWSISLNDAGFIQLADERGEARKVISYNGYVYIFRDKGISRLSASGAQEDFYLSHLFVSSGKIYDKTIALCGDRILFVASDGLYAFNGSDTVKILEDVSPLIMPSSESEAVFYNGRYYLTCHIDFEDEVYRDGEKTNNAVFALDISTNEYVIYRGLSVQSMAVIERLGKYNLVLLNDASEGQSVEENMLLVDSDTSLECKARYATGLYDFGEPSARKVVRKVMGYVKNGESVLVTIFNESGEAVSVNLEEHTNLIPVMIDGKSIGFIIDAIENVELESLQVEVF